jgi:hypothetical protein
MFSLFRKQSIARASEQNAMNWRIVTRQFIFHAVYIYYQEAIYSIYGVQVSVGSQ